MYVMAMVEGGTNVIEQPTLGIRRKYRIPERSQGIPRTPGIHQHNQGCTIPGTSRPYYPDDACQCGRHGKELLSDSAQQAVLRCTDGAAVDHQMFVPIACKR